MNLAELDKYGLTWHQKVAYLGTQMLGAPDAKAETPVEHLFEPDVYIREMRIPAGTLFIGRPHRFGHGLRFVSGDVRLITPTGDWNIRAPYETHTAPGFITVLESLTDVVVRTYHPNPDECRDAQLMEDVIFHPASEMQQVSDMVSDRIRSLS